MNCNCKSNSLLSNLKSGYSCRMFEHLQSIRDDVANLTKVYVYNMFVRLVIFYWPSVDDKGYIVQKIHISF